MQWGDLLESGLNSALCWNHTLTLDPHHSTGPLSQQPTKMTDPDPRLSSPEADPPPSHSQGPIFTRVLVPSNWPITALTKSFICLNSFCPMLPEPSMRKTISIAWFGHSVEREGRIRDAHMDPSHFLGPGKLSTPQSQGIVLGVGINSHPVPNTLHWRDLNLLP